MEISLSLNKVLLQTLPYELIDFIAKKNAIKAYNKAINVPAYKRFLNEQKYEVKPLFSNSEFISIPISSKANYIQQNKLQDLSIGKNPLSFYRSSGYSGTPTYWAQNKEEFNSFIKYAELNLKLVFNIHKQKTLLVSLFALSSWITGQQMLASLFSIANKYKNVSFFSCGMIVDEPLDLIKKVGAAYDQIIIFTYPLTFKALMDKAKEEGVDLKKYNIKIVLGAEGVTYEWAKYYNDLLKSDSGQAYYIYSAYGTADTGIGIAAEQVACLVLKDICHKYPEILEALTGTTEMPLHFFQYNPLQTYFEVEDEELIVTKNKQVPLIRYNLHDKGRIITPSKIVKILKSRGINIKELVVKQGAAFLNLPFLAVYGRDDGTIILNGANVYLNSFKEALSQQELIALHTGKFLVSTFHDSEMFQNYKVEIELRKSVPPTDHTRELFRKSIVSFLLKNDKGYTAAYHKPYQRDDICKVDFITFPDNQIKHKYQNEKK